MYGDYVGEDPIREMGGGEETGGEEKKLVVVLGDFAVELGGGDDGDSGQRGPSCWWWGRGYWLWWVDEDGRVAIIETVSGGKFEGVVPVVDQYVVVVWLWESKDSVVLLDFGEERFDIFLVSENGHR